MPLDEFSVQNPGLSFTSSTSLVIAGLMLFMSFRLYARNRRDAYRSLLVSLGFIVVHHSLQLALAIGLVPGSVALSFAGKLLQVFAFIVMNFAVFELYHKSKPRTRVWFYGLLLFGAGMAAVGLLTSGSFRLGEPIHTTMAFTPALDGYMLVLPPLFWLMFASQIGQQGKYVASLGLSFAAQLANVGSTYGLPSSAGLLLLARLLPVIYYILLFMLLFERVVELLQSAYRSSITDGLTNLYNRRYFAAQLDRALRTGQSVGVVFCDIDNFKRLNDTHGHHKADGVLKQAAAILAEETESTGLAGRYGGEELVAFVTGTAAVGLQAAEAIRSRIEKETVVTVSVGFAFAPKGAGASGSFTAETLLKRADQAMYRSKTTGKNRVTDFGALSRSAQTVAAASAASAVRETSH